MCCHLHGLTLGLLSVTLYLQGFRLSYCARILGAAATLNVLLQSRVMLQAGIHIVEWAMHRLIQQALPTSCRDAATAQQAIANKTQYIHDIPICTLSTMSFTNVTYLLASMLLCTSIFWVLPCTVMQDCSLRILASRGLPRLFAAIVFGSWQVMWLLLLQGQCHLVPFANL